MFSLSISFGPLGTTWRLLYKTIEQAQNHFGLLRGDRTKNFALQELVELNDDFGQLAVFKRESVHAAMLENLDESKVGMIELGLHNARVQGQLQQRAEADPVIRASAAGRRSPAVIEPFMGSRGNGPWQG